MRARHGGPLLVTCFRICLLTAAAAGAWVAARSGSPSVALEPGAEEPAALRLEPTEVDLGRVPLESAQTLEVPWRRTGPGNLRVRALKTGCGCARAEGLPEVLDEGARGVLTVRLAPRKDPGPFAVAVEAFTTASAPLDVVRVRVRGFAGDEVVLRPAVLDLGLRSPGARVGRRAEVHLPPGLAGAEVVADLAGVEGTVAVVEPMLAGRVGPDVLLSLLVPAVTGPFEGHVVVRAGERRLALPVRGVVVSERTSTGP